MGHPGPVQAIAANLAIVSDCLQDTSNSGDDVPLPCDEIFKLAGAAAGLHPDLEGHNNRTAVGWALGLPEHRRQGVISIMSTRIPRMLGTNSCNCEATLAVV